MTARWPGWMMAGYALVFMSLLTACDDGPPQQEVATANNATTEPAPWFQERAAELGLDFFHFNGATPEAFLAEIMGSGCALLDYDNDGDLDVYLVQGGRINSNTPLRFPASETGHDGSLFENRLIPDGTLAFRDVSATSGLHNIDTGMGVATADLNNDGYQDLYLANLGPDALFLNNGDGTFADHSARLGEETAMWSSSATFLDYDRDGNLDLVVASYVDMDRNNARQCNGTAGLRDYCSPDVYRPLPDPLLRGDGQGNLSVVENWQMTAATGSGLGVTAADYDGDGLIDIYVANDKKPNQLWRNLGNGRFEDTAILSGVALNGDGKEEASMGVTTGDYDADGDADLFMTHLKAETHTLFVNNGQGLFFDGTLAAGLAASSIPATGFGTRWFDADLDGDLDIFVANGAVMAESAQLNNEPFPYLQRNQLFENVGGGKFADASDKAGFPTEKPEISRGAAFGDIDNDGDIDILVSNNHGPARLLINEVPRNGDWLSVRLYQPGGNRDGIGARIGVETNGGIILWRPVTTGDSYSSASDLRTHIGLGAIGRGTVSLRVVWPDGQQEDWSGIPVNTTITLTRGTGEPTS